LLLTQTANAKPVTVLITEYVGKYTTNYPILAAGGVMALIPPAILALALNKRITGMLAGASGAARSRWRRAPNTFPAGGGGGKRAAPRGQPGGFWGRAGRPGAARRRGRGGGG